MTDDQLHHLINLEEEINKDNTLLDQEIDALFDKKKENWIRYYTFIRQTETDATVREH